MTWQTIGLMVLGFSLWFGLKFAFPETSMINRAIVLFGGLLTVWLVALAFRKSNG